MKDQTAIFPSTSRLGRVQHWLPLLTGLVVMPVWQLAQAAVTVDQVPLTVQQSLAPNITLMLDDSGSMAWDVMPDHAYLSDNGTDGLVSSDVNGVYYNPNTSYLPPYNADGTTRYTAYSFNSAPPNGFSPTSPAPVDIKSYDGGSDSSGFGTTKPDFSNAFTINTPAVYQTTTPNCASGYSLQTDANPSSSVGRCVQIQTATASCPSGYTLSNAGTASVSCTVSPTTILATCPSSYSGPQSSGSNKGKCTRSSPDPKVISAQCNTSPYTQLINGSSSSPDCAAPAASPCASGYTADASGVCTTTVVATPTCPSSPTGYSLINQNTQNVTCRREQTPASSSTVDMFTYTVLSGGSYTRHYVGDFGSCALITASNSTPQVAAAVCHDDDATRQNVANWFSYYHTRILLAKSGLMNAFSGLESTVRFGFGSIDGGTGDGNDNYLNLPTSRYSYTDGYNNGTNYIATVAPFGNGSSGTQKAQFWNWVDNAVANQGTPLRQALGAVGQYYQTAQPWQTSSSDRTELACRQSYAILTTDGFWNDGDSDTALPSTPYTTNVDNLVVTTTTSTLDTRPAFCAAGYTLNTSGSPNLGKCVQVQTATASCPSGYTMSNPGTATVACTVSPTTILATCPSTYAGPQTSGSNIGRCTRSSPSPRVVNAQCNTSPYTTLINGSSDSPDCSAPAASPCPSGYAADASGVCARTNVATPSCPVASNPSSPSYSLTNPNTATVDCQRTITTSTSSSSVTNTGSNGQTYTFTAAAPYADSVSNTLADTAMYYWLSDLRPSLDNKVPTSTEDPAFWQHMTTFTLGLGFTPTNISPTGTTIPQIFNWANGGTAISGFSWPTPTANSINNIADLAHAAVNGHGGFYSATTPEGFSNGITDALKRVNERIGTGASLAANSTKLETGTTTYQAVYFTGRWKGDLKAFSVNPSTGVISTSPSWSAANTGVFPAASSRVIKTYNPTLSAGSRVVDFSAPSDLSTAQQTALGATTAAQQAVIDYLRGDASDEQKNGGTFRNRDTALGDIVDSQPVYVGAPDSNLFFGRTFTGSSTYPAFAADKLTRAPRIWVAANDGMLHSFNASTGAEVFAFLPDAVIRSGVKELSNAAYGSNSVPHQYFNDGELTIADVYYSSAWHTVLVGTTGRGTAKAVYALDITDPNSPTVLWERSATDGLSNSAYIGQIVGRPVVAQTANGSWSVLMGNGYNSTNGTAALLKFSIEAGTLSVYTTDSTTNNGLAAPAVWLADPTTGIGTTAYAGDLTGKVWAFDLSGTAGTNLFTALDASSVAQPITAGMLAGRDPTTGNLWLFFGTGRYLAQSELTDTSVQTWYGIIVQSATASLVSNLSSGRSALRQRQVLAEQAATSTSLAARAISASTAGDMVGKSGWYTDLKLASGTARGERMVTSNQFQGSLLIGTTRVPTISDPCSPSGNGWIMAVNPFTGAAPASAFFDINSDGQFDTADSITIGGTTYVVAGVGFSSIPNNPIFVGNTMLISFDNASTGSVNTRGTVGTLLRQSWRELVGQ